MRAALVLGLFGLVILVQAPGVGAPFLLLAAFVLWRARRGAADGAVSAPLTIYATVRALLLLVAAGAALCALLTTTTVLSAFAMRGTLNWDYSGIGALIAGVCAWGALATWRFRAGFIEANMARQLIDGAVRVAAASVGFFILLIVMSCLPSVLSDTRSNGARSGLCLVLPALFFVAALALGFAHRDRLAQLLPSRPVLRGALWAASAGGASGVVITLLCVALSRASFEELSWTASCALICAAAAADARATEPQARRFGFAAGGAFMIAIGALLTLMWIGQFRMGERMIEGWNVLILLMPVVFIATMALAVALMIFGWRLYRRAYASA